MAPEGWRVIRLEELSDIVGGTTPSRSEPRYWENGIVPWVTPTDVTRLPPGAMKIVGASESVSQIALDETSLSVLPIGTTLMTSRATIGDAVVAGSQLTTNQGFCAFLPSAALEPLFLAYWICWKKPRFEALGAGSTFLEVSKSTVRKEKIILPPLPEQKKIADILGSVDDAIAKTKAVIEQTKQVKKGLLQELLTKGIGHTKFKQTPIGEIPESWEVCTIAECCVRVVDCPHSTPEYMDSGFPVVRTPNVRDGRLIMEGMLFTHEDGYRHRIERETPQPGDIILTREAPAGEACLVPEGASVCLGQRTVLLRPNANIEAAFLVAALYSPAIRTQLAQEAGGTTVSRINMSDLRNLKVPCPKLPEQERIIELIESTSLTEASAVRELSILGSLKTGLLQKLLSGQVRVTL